MRQSHTEEFSEKLYSAMRQASESVNVPSFDLVAERISKGESVESFEQFFADEAESAGAAKSRRFRARTFGTAAAAVVLVASGVWVNRMIGARSSFDAASSKESAAQVACSLDQAAADSMENGEMREDCVDMAEQTDETVKNAENPVVPDSNDCTEMIISGGRALMIPLNELADNHIEAK